MFIPRGPSELNTPLFLVRQLQVSWGVGSLWGKYSTGSNINTQLQLQLQNKKGFMPQEDEAKTKGDIWLHTCVFL